MEPRGSMPHSHGLSNNSHVYVNVHQILPETGQQSGGKHLEDSDEFW